MKNKLERDNTSGTSGNLTALQYQRQIVESFKVVRIRIITIYGISQRGYQSTQNTLRKK